MMGDHRSRMRRGRQVLLAGAAALLLSGGATLAAPEKPFEINVTNDPSISSGEPEIAVDPTNPRRLAVIEFANGSSRRPASTFVMSDLDDLLKDPAGAMANVGRVMISTDGGAHWAQQGPPPAYAVGVTPRLGGGGDPFIGFGPDGTLYAGDEAGPLPKPRPGVQVYQLYGEILPRSNVTLAASRDGGKTFAPPQNAETGIDRPWIAVDQSTGTVYTTSVGSYNETTRAHNVRGADAPEDRWIVAWKPHLAGKSDPHRAGGPDFTAGNASTITAAHGVLAASFVLGGIDLGGGRTPVRTTAVPASLAALTPAGVTSCTPEALCLFFETSVDQGVHWTRHYVPVPGGLHGRMTNVAADPGVPGRYAIALLNPAATSVEVLVTTDSGATWSAPATVPETATGANFKQWMAYGPTGALALVWKKRRDDLTPPLPPPPPGPVEASLRTAREAAFDVYASVSCDGGSNWAPAVRMNAAPSPAGPPGSDDFTYISLDARYAHMVWGDRRLQPTITNVPGAAGGVQAYYGRLPFSAISDGKACGRSR